MPRVSAYPPEKSHAIRLDEVSIKSEKRCNSNDLNSRFEIVLGELHAKLRVGSGMWEVGAGCEGRGPSRGLACEGSEVGWARLRCPWWCSESAPEKSHAIRLREVPTKSENVAIPTI